MRALIFYLLLVAAGAAQAAPDDAADIRQTLTAMWAALEQGNLDEYARHVHPDYTVFGEGDVFLAEGKALELRGMAEWLSRAKNVHTEMHQPRVTVRGDTAWITYYWTDSGVVEGERFTSRGKSTRIFVRDDGRWRCIHGHFTAVP